MYRKVELETMYVVVKILKDSTLCIFMPAHMASIITGARKKVPANKIAGTANLLLV